MATEDWFDNLTDFLPSADLIEQWQAEPESRPATLTVEGMLQWLTDLYRNHADQLASLSAAAAKNTHLQTAVQQLEADVARLKYDLQSKDAALIEWRKWADNRLQLEAARKPRPKKETECSLTTLI